MNTRNLMVAVLLMAGSFTMGSFAQENIKALVQKCENMDDARVDIVRRKGEENNQVTHLMLNYTPALEKELFDAFRKDEDKATRVIESKQGGKTINLLYEFEDGKVKYSFDIIGNNISITVIER